MTRRAPILHYSSVKAPYGSAPLRKWCVMTRYALATAVLAVGLTSATFAKATVATSTPIVNNVDPVTPAPSTKSQILTITGQEFMPGLTLTVSEPEGNKTVIQGKAITNQTAVVVPGRR